MKKSILILAAAILSMGSYAQTPVTSTSVDVADQIVLKSANGPSMKKVSVLNFENVVGNRTPITTGTETKTVSGNYSFAVGSNYTQTITASSGSSLLSTAGNFSLTATGGLILTANTTVTGTLGVSGLFSPAALVRNSAGSAAAPAYSYTGQTDMGNYKISSTQSGFAVSGALVGGWNVSGLFTGTITEQVAGSGITFAKQTFQQRTATTYTASASVTGAELAKGLLTVSSGTCTLTLPTGTDLGGVIGATAGTTFNFVVLNIASGGTATVAANTNAIAETYGTNTLTLANSASVGAAIFKVTFISPTAYIFGRTP